MGCYIALPIQTHTHTHASAFEIPLNFVALVAGKIISSDIFPGFSLTTELISLTTQTERTICCHYTHTHAHSVICMYINIYVLDHKYVCGALTPFNTTQIPPSPLTRSSHPLIKTPWASKPPKPPTRCRNVLPGHFIKLITLPTSGMKDVRGCWGCWGLRREVKWSGKLLFTYICHTFTAITRNPTVKTMRRILAKG